MSHIEDGSERSIVRKQLIRMEPDPEITPWNVHVPGPNDKSTLFKKRPFWVGKYHTIQCDAMRNLDVLLINGRYYFFDVGLYKPLSEVKVKFIWLLVRLQKFFKKRYATIQEKRRLNLALCMSRHGRLGKDSALSELPDDVFGKVLSKLGVRLTAEDGRLGEMCHYVRNAKPSLNEVKVDNNSVYFYGEEYTIDFIRTFDVFGNEIVTIKVQEIDGYQEYKNATMKNLEYEMAQCGDGE